MNAAFGDLAATSPRSIATISSPPSPTSKAAASTSPMCAPARSRPGATWAYTVAHVVCRETEQEARDYYEHYSRVHEDTAAVDYHMKQKQGFSNSHDAQAYQQYRQRFAAGTGSYPLVGTPEQIGRAGAHARSGLRRRGAHLRQLRAGAALLLRTGPAPLRDAGLRVE